MRPGKLKEVADIVWIATIGTENLLPTAIEPRLDGVDLIVIARAIFGHPQFSSERIKG